MASFPARKLDIDRTETFRLVTELEVGCGNQAKREPHILNCDLYPNPNVDVAFDLQKEWPFPDNSFLRVRGFHVLEHLANPQAFFAEAWRVLKPGGIVRLQLPYGPSNDGLTDITHVHYWLPGTFAFLQPDYHLCSGNAQHDAWRFPFAIDYIACRINKDLRWLVKGPWKSWGLKALWHLWGGHLEMSVGLHTLKTPEAIAEFHQYNASNMVPVGQIIAKHELEGRELREGEVREHVQLTARGITTRLGEKPYVFQPTYSEGVF